MPLQLADCSDLPHDEHHHVALQPLTHAQIAGKEHCRCLRAHIDVLQALRILSHSADAEIDNPDTPLALWDKLEKEVRGGFLGMLTVRATFQLRQAGLAAKRYEHIGLVCPFAIVDEEPMNYFLDSSPGLSSGAVSPFSRQCSLDWPSDCA